MAAVRVEGVEHHQPGVVNPAIGIFECQREFRLERHPLRGLTQFDATAAGQLVAGPEMVVDQQSQAYQPGGALLG